MLRLLNEYIFQNILSPIFKLCDFKSEFRYSCIGLGSGLKSRARARFLGLGYRARAQAWYFGLGYRTRFFRTRGLKFLFLNCGGNIFINFSNLLEYTLRGAIFNKGHKSKTYTLLLHTLLHEAVQILFLWMFQPAYHVEKAFPGDIAKFCDS